ncbi:MAG: hypothetical protein R2729_17425 [Bryobacteraceae bacterium]
MFKHRILRALKPAAVLALVTGSALAQPGLNSVSNAGSYTAPIAPGSIFVGFGRGIGPDSIRSAPSLPLGTALEGSSVNFTPVSGGAAIDAFMFYTLATQISGILPSTTPPGDYNVTVTYNGQTSQPARVTVAERAFGMLTLAGTGTGPAVMQNVVSATELTVNQFTAPARPGQTIILYGTGLGGVSVADNIAPGAQDLRAAASVKVIVGGVEIDPLYAGRSPQFPGLDQINFTLPSDIPTGCTVPLQVRAGGVTTQNPVNISIAAEGQAVCRHPLLTEDALRKVAAGQSVSVASFSLNAFQISATVPLLGELTLRSETVSGGVSSVTLSTAADFSLDATANSLAPGSCVVQRIRTQGLSITPATGSPALQYDAGTSLTLNGPNVSNKSVPRGSANQYSAELVALSLPVPGAPAPQPVIARGEYTLTAPGGAGVQAFTARTQVSERAVWTNRGDIALIGRSRPLTLNWTGGGADDIALIVGGGGTQVGTAENPSYDATVFACAARGNAGAFTVPAEVTGQIPAVQTDLITQRSIGLLGLIVQSNPSAGRFDATLATGAPVDFATFGSAAGALKLLNVQ